MNPSQEGLFAHTFCKHNMERRVQMKSETKDKLRGFALKSAEFIIDDMSKTAKRASKSKNFSEEQQDWYADSSDRLDSLSRSIGNFREKKERD